MIIKAIAYPLDLIEILSLASRRGGFKEIFRGDTDWLVKPAPTPIEIVRSHTLFASKRAQVFADGE